MSFLARLLDKSTDATSAIAGVFVVVMMLHIVADVLAKWLFNYPIVGTLEIVANYYMVALIFLPLAYVQRAGGHIIVEVEERPKDDDHQIVGQAEPEMSGGRCWIELCRRAHHGLRMREQAFDVWPQLQRKCRGDDLAADDL